jgi:hypothetical protein
MSVEKAEVVEPLSLKPLSTHGPDEQERPIVVKTYLVRLTDGRQLRAIPPRSCRGKGREYLVGQTVSVELSPYDPLLCRIVPSPDEGITVTKYR